MKGMLNKAVKNYVNITAPVQNGKAEVWGLYIIFHGEVLILLIYKYCIIIWLLHSAIMNIHSDYSSLEIFFLNVIYSRAFSPMQAIFLFP